MCSSDLRDRKDCRAVPMACILRKLDGTRDLKEDWGHILKDCSQDAFTLHMEVIEIKNKATYPIGEIALDGFGQKHTYEDRGVRKRALLAGGKVDYGLPEMLIPVEKGVAIVGASSDHTIIDVEDMERELKVGDVLEFQLTYAKIGRAHV